MCKYRRRRRNLQCILLLSIILVLIGIGIMVAEGALHCYSIMTLLASLFLGGSVAWTLKDERRDFLKNNAASTIASTKVRTR